MFQYIAESSKKAQMGRKEYTLFGHVTVQVTHPLPEKINLQTVLKDIEAKIPRDLLEDLDSVYIGQYDTLKTRQIDSMYVEGSILISSDQPSNRELFGTFIHEFAHAIEEGNKNIIYSDGTLAREFLAKRKTLYNLLKDDYKLDQKSFLDIDFNQNFDTFAYKTVGYDNLGVITNGLFVSPYACTSLREYFANGFEHYFLNDASELKEKSPVLLRKIKQVLKRN